MQIQQRRAWSHAGRMQALQTRKEQPASLQSSSTFEILCHPHWSSTSDKYANIDASTGITVSDDASVEARGGCHRQTTFKVAICDSKSVGSWLSRYDYEKCGP